MLNTNFNIISEFLSIHIRTKTQHTEKSASLSFKLNLLALPRLTQGNLREYRYTLTSFRAPPRAKRVILQRKMSVTIILNAPLGKGASQIKVHCHPPRTTPRSARRFAAPNDSPFYSTRFLRLGGCAPTRRERHCHCYSTRFLRLGERAPSISDLQIFATLAKKKENLGVPNGA